MKKARITFRKRDNDPKILLFDIETAPNLAYVWGKYEQDVIEYERHWYMLSFSAKWFREKEITTMALPDYARFKKDKFDDTYLLESLWQLFDEADILIAHNGDEFDIKKANALFAKHGLPPPSPYKSIDTKKVAKRYFKFDSNKLDDLGHYFGVGRKLKHTGFALWLGCMEGDKKSWELMKRYNAQDVALLERVYIKMLPWMMNHPNRNAYREVNCCPKCGSNKIHARGYMITVVGKKQRFQCQNCGGWSHGKSESIKGLVIR